MPAVRVAVLVVCRFFIMVCLRSDPSCPRDTLVRWDTGEHGQRKRVIDILQIFEMQKRFLIRQEPQRACPVINNDRG